MDYAFTFSPPTKPWSTNQERNLHHYDRAELIREWHGATRLAFTSYRNRNGISVPLPRGVVQVTIPFNAKRRRDPHNYCGTVVKAVIDGLVSARAWPDDTPDYVGHRESILYVGDTVHVTISSLLRAAKRSLG